MYAKLRGNFCLIYIGIALFYILFDWNNKVYAFIPLYELIIVASGICLVINRLRYFDLANGLMIIFSNALVYLFVDSDDPLGGGFFYFLATSLAAMILLSYELRYWAFGFVIVSVGLGILAFTTDFNPITAPVIQDNGIIRLTFLINFILATITCTFIVFFLIKENHHAEKELKRTNEKLEMAVMGTKAGIYEWDIKKGSILVSAYWRELLGITEGELPHITLEALTSLFHPEDIDRVNQTIQEVLKNHQPYQIELRLRTKTNGFRWFLDSGIVKTDQTGHAFLIIGSLIDIEDRKKAEQEIIVKNNQLIKSNEELDRFVYSASHDMRGPLSSILGLINLARNTDQIEQFRTYHDLMKERVDVLENFIKQVTDYSRGTKLDLDVSEFSLSAITKAIINE
jgi:PAS domain S-box-containing protein